MLQRCGRGQRVERPGSCWPRDQGGPGQVPARRRARPGLARHLTVTATGDRDLTPGLQDTIFRVERSLLAVTSGDWAGAHTHHTHHTHHHHYHAGLSPGGVDQTLHTRLRSFLLPHDGQVLGPAEPTRQ